MISIANLSVFLGERILLNSINVVIGEKDRVGLVGRNGAGKSTLLKLIAGANQPGAGTISKPSNATVGFLHQEMSIPKGRTVISETLTAFEGLKETERELNKLNIELAHRTDYETDSYMDLISKVTDLSDRYHILGGDTMQADAERVLTGLGFLQKDMHRLTDEFSGGWQMRIELAKMLLSKPNYLLLDEPTNHLDIESIMWLESFLVDYPGAVVLVSHDKQFLNNVTNRTVEIELGKINDYKANYEKYVQMREERRAMTENAFNNQQRMIAQKEKTISRFMAKASKTTMAQSMQKQLDKLDRVEFEDEDIKAMNLRFPPAPRSGQVVLEGINISKSYGDLHVLNDVDFKLDRGDRVAFVGQNGQGKTTLAKILIEAEKASKGEVNLGHNVQVGYYAQNQSDTMYLNNTLLETMEFHSPPEMRTKLRSILGAFMFSGDDVSKKVSVLSGGERARLALACLLLKPFNLLILDEPTNHLDMLSKEVLKDAIMKYDGSLIVVSHDREFLAGLTTTTMEFRDKKLHEYLGDINYFLEKRNLENMRQVEMATQNKTAKVTTHIANGSNPDNQKQIKHLEKRIEDTEKQIAVIEEKMAAANFYESTGSQTVLKEYHELKTKVNEWMEEWEALV
jgi:ATP-binding cassette, subfamily F, member 3